MTWLILTLALHPRNKLGMLVGDRQIVRLVSSSRAGDGHYAYDGILGNFRRVSWYAHEVAWIWQMWLSRRGSRFLWDRFHDLLKWHPLPRARIVHRYTAVSEALP